MSRESDSVEDDYDDTYEGTVQPHRGVLILVLGILGLMVCGIIGIFAWILGKGDLELMRRGVMDKEGEAMTRVGYILGIVATILMAIGLVLVVLYFVLIIAFVAAR
jgi:hypothetical protein